MDGADPPAVAPDAQPGVLGRLPPVRPQHRSARRGGPRTTATNGAGTNGAGTNGHRASATRPALAAPAVTAPAIPARPAPAVPAPPPAPRSGWATPEPDRAPSTALPPLVALVDGTVRTGGQVLLGVLRRLPRI